MYDAIDPDFLYSYSLVDKKKLRQLYAGQALQGLLMAQPYLAPTRAAQLSLEFTDALIAALEKPPQD